MTPPIENLEYENDRGPTNLSFESERSDLLVKLLGVITVIAGLILLKL